MDTRDTPSADLAASVAGLRFYSRLWPNLHHVLYAAAWQRRAVAADGALRSPMARLPAALADTLTPEDTATWHAAISYYDEHLASKDLLFSPDMMRLNQALAVADLDGDQVPARLAQTLHAVEPIYRRQFWPGHDAVNRAWIADASARLADVAPTAVPRLEALYGENWHSPVAVDAVWVGRYEGAYTVLDPDHTTVSTTAAALTGWAAAEILLHEASHLLVGGLAAELAAALGGRSGEHAVLWHTILFFLTGTVTVDVLAERGVGYVPYLDATGLFDRAWPHYRRPVQTAWMPYVRGECTRSHAIAETVRMLGEA